MFKRIDLFSYYTITNEINQNINEILKIHVILSSGLGVGIKGNKVLRFCDLEQFQCVFYSRL